ncbi:MAG: hypothetical protein LBF89_10425 [Bacteroidales bacterium]|nr:hypothetical protein [Bacteroidales bacterium]
MKKRVSETAICLLIAASVPAFNGCGIESNKDQGKAAAADFCSCFKTKSRNACLEELKGQYAHSVYISDAFIDAFNDAQTCGVTLERIPVSSSVVNRTLTIEDAANGN